MIDHAAVINNNTNMKKNIRTKSQLYCPNCGFPLQGGEQSCPECGVTLDYSNQSTAGANQAAAGHIKSKAGLRFRNAGG